MAAPVIAERLVTADELADMPKDAEGRKRELLDGRIVVMSHPGDEHSQSAMNVSAALRAYARPLRLGIIRMDMGFIIRRNPDRMVCPDASFTANSRLDPNRDKRKAISGPPTLAVEVVSPNDTDREVASKADEYLEAGTERVWVVRPPQRSVTVFHAGGAAHVYRDGDTLTSGDAGFAVEGFALPVADVFAED